jgi:uncharacterized protein YkwD
MVASALRAPRAQGSTGSIATGFSLSEVAADGRPSYRYPWICGLTVPESMLVIPEEIMDRIWRSLTHLGGALLAGSLAAGLAAAGAGAATPSDAGGAASVEVSAVADRIVARTNRFRGEHAAPVVEVARDLRDASRYFAAYVASSDVYSHTADGTEPAERAESHGYDVCIVTENIAYAYREAGFPDEDTLAEALVQGWIDSPGHRRNMIDGDVTEIGVGVARSEHSGRYYAVQMFGRPQAQAIEFSIANDWTRAVHYELGGRALALDPGQLRRHRVCRPPQLEISFPRRQRRADRTLRPQAGDRIVILNRSGEAGPEVVRR